MVYIDVSSTNSARKDVNKKLTWDEKFVVLTDGHCEDTIGMANKFTEVRATNFHGTCVIKTYVRNAMLHVIR